jgi:hypothetical protein
MDQSESKFFYADHEMTFTVFSDFPCRARYAGSIPPPLTRDHVETYEIEPAVGSQWVVVEERDGDKVIERLFMRKGNLFPQTDPGPEVPTKHWCLRKESGSSVENFRRTTC